MDAENYQNKVNSLMLDLSSSPIEKQLKRMLNIVKMAEIMGEILDLSSKLKSTETGQTYLSYHAQKNIEATMKDCLAKRIGDYLACYTLAIALTPFKLSALVNRAENILTGCCEEITDSVSFEILAKSFPKYNGQAIKRFLQAERCSRSDFAFLDLALPLSSILGIINLHKLDNLEIIFDQNMKKLGRIVFSFPESN